MYAVGRDLAVTQSKIRPKTLPTRIKKHATFVNPIKQSKQLLTDAAGTLTRQVE